MLSKTFFKKYEFINFQRWYCLKLVSESSCFDKGIKKNYRKSNCFKFCSLEQFHKLQIRKISDYVSYLEFVKKKSVTQFSEVFNISSEEKK